MGIKLCTQRRCLLSHAPHVLTGGTRACSAVAKLCCPGWDSFHSQGFRVTSAVSSCTARGATTPLILGKASSNDSDILESRNGTILVSR